MLQKIKAGALQLTMFIVIVIALLLASFIILINTHKRFTIQTDFVLETIENANEGIDYALQNNISSNDTIIVNLKDEDYKTLKVYQDYWGLYEKVMSTSKIKTNTYKRIALLGALQPLNDRIALYVEDQNKPLVVVGNTKIEGVAYLPMQGVRTGSISGHSYYGSQLIYGLTKKSVELPKLLNGTLEHIKAIANNIENVNTNQFLDLKTGKTHKNSFYNPFQVIYSNTDIVLSDISLTGHILVQSKTKISLDKSSVLKDVILIAPIIEIQNESKGTFQAIATKEITIGENCILDYPSAFILIEEDLVIKDPIENISNDVETPFIKICMGANVKGVIAYLGHSKNYKAQVFVDENATITGEIYCNQNLELLGTVYGSVFTNNFVANQSGSSYQNHIYNATISINGLDQEYVGLLFENSKKGVAKWMY